MNTTRLNIFLFLAAPGFAWIWLAAFLCRMSFEHGPADDDTIDEVKR